MGFSIIIHDLIVEAHIGITDEERAQAQHLKINIRIELNASVNPQNDDMQETVDYNAIVQAVRNLAEISRFNLLETFAQNIGRMCLSDPRSQSVTIRAEKLDIYDDCFAGIELNLQK